MPLKFFSYSHSICKKVCLSIVFILSGFLLWAESPSFSIPKGEKEIVLLSSPPGLYPQNVNLKILPLVKGADIYYAFLVSGGKYSPYIPYSGPINLSAVRGEKRNYRLKIILKKNDRITGTRIYDYTIDKKSPLPPLVVINGKNCFYNDFELYNGAKISFVSVGKDKNIKIYYSINKDIFSGRKLWNGGSVILEGTEGEKKTYTVQWFGEDRAGNRSVIRSIRFVVNREKPYIRIISPVDGNFANYQYLVILSKNLQWIKYTLDGTDPKENGKIYSGPVLIKKTGNLIINVIGKPYSSKNFLRKQVEVQIKPEKNATLYCDTESGIYKNGLKVAVRAYNKATLYYTLSENTPQQYDFAAKKSILLPSLPEAEKFYVLRLRAKSGGGKWGEEYRFFYIIDRKKPEKPEIKIDRCIDKNGNPLKKYLVRIYSHGDVKRIYYSLNGNLSVNSHQAGNSKEFKGPFFIVPEKITGKKVGVINIRAVAIDKAGNVSESANMPLKFDFTLPPVPKLKFSYLKRRGVFSISEISYRSNIPDNKNNSVNLLYEISAGSEEPSPLTYFSPRINEKLEITVPYGVQETFKLRLGIMGKGGIVSSVGKVMRIKIDRMPPPEPLILLKELAGKKVVKAKSGEIFDQDVKLTIDSEGVVYYTLTSDGTMPDDPTLSSKQIMIKNGEGEILLKGEKGKRFVYYLKLLCVDNSGNQSRVYGPFKYIIDQRIPVVPPIKSYEPGKYYGNNPLVFEFPEHSYILHYTFSDTGKDPPDPNFNSPVVGKRLVFNGEVGKEKRFIVKILPISVKGHIVGKVKKLHFTIDLKPPLVPFLTGFKDGGIYRKPIYLKLRDARESLDQDVTVFLSYSTGKKAPPDPIKFGKIVRDSYLLDLPQGREAVFKIRVSALDKAGNRSLYDRFYTVTIDKKPPSAVIVEGLPERGITDRAVVITLTCPGAKIFYNITDDGSRPPIPGLKALRYNSPIILSGEEGKVITYKIFPRAVDEAGNFTEDYRIYTIVIDREKPLPPPPPTVKYSNPHRKEQAVILWNGYEDRIFYRINGATYKEYTHPFIVRKSSLIEFFGMDMAGNKSEVKRISVHLGKTVLTPPKIVGVINGKLYNKGVTLSFLAPAGEVHYEMSVNGVGPTEVTENSPVFKNPIEIDALNGETLKVSIKARVFDSYGNLSGISKVEFTIDRTPPKAPIIIGVENGMRYQNSRKISLVSDEGTIYYSISSNGQDPQIPPEAPKYRYRESVLLKAIDGKIVDYRILAYTVDKAGNRSRDIPLWRIILDRKIIYVATNGNDLYEGTSSSPLKSIEKAIAMAGQRGRKTIYLSYGVYKINHPVLSTINGLTIVGGFDPINWEKSNFYETKITTGKYFTNKIPLVKTGNGSLSLKNVMLASSDKNGRYMIEISNGKLNIENCKIAINSNKTKWAILQYGGSLNINSTSFTGNTDTILNSNGYVLSTGGELYIVGSTFNTIKTSDSFSAIKVIENKKTSLRGIKIAPFISKNISAISISGGELELMNSNIDSGIATERGIALKVKNSHIKAVNNVIRLNNKSAYSLGISVEGGRARIKKNIVYVGAKYGAAGVQIKGGNTIFEKNRLYGLSSNEYLYLLDVEGNGKYFNNLLCGGRSNDIINLQILDSSPDIFNNTLFGGMGRDILVSLMIRGKSHPRIINNIIAGGRFSGAERGIGIFVSGNRLKFGFPIIANDISGWSSLVKIEALKKKKSIYKYQSSPVEKIFINTERFNLYDNNPFGGNIDKNISEDISKTFLNPAKKDFNLKRSSRCINGGIDLGGENYNGPGDDIEGKDRPAPFIGIKPMYDIGAYEFY